MILDFGLNHQIRFRREERQLIENHQSIQLIEHSFLSLSSERDDYHN